MDEHVLLTYRRAEEVFVDGDGAEIRDAQGRVFLDFLSGIAVNALGHAHPELVAALQEQVTQLLHVSNLYRHPYTEEVASRIAHLTGLEACFFSNSGAEAVEAALKIARKHQRNEGRPERTGFVALEGSFHGRTFGALSVTHTEKYRAPFEPLLQGVTFVPPGDAAALEKALAPTKGAAPAALILEPIQGESGVRELPFEYLRLARRLCDATGTVLIHDEVQCGCGRTGNFLAAEAAGVTPDVVTLAKPIAAGLPMGVTVVSKALAGALEPGDHGSTFAGGPFVCRAALVFLRLVDTGLLEQVRARGQQLRRGLETIERDFPVVIELRGRGLMQGVRLSRGAEELQKELYRRGLIVNRTGGDVIRLLPPYVITSAQVHRGLDLLREGLETLGR
ncbi:MAG TPA: acetylornithine/succinylornithine family transaminase [Planctomycetota bacterium]|jgi:predicted acetylornithine/succinylornithine family transaminase|nr:acetylornithine/succinylornithine family transaminase [Planctomycetota bacterium]